jgi:hypothetical protein
LKAVAAYAEGYRELWEKRLDNLEAYLEELQKQQKESSNGKKRRSKQ